jgi:hypothetical protein
VGSDAAGVFESAANELHALAGGPAFGRIDLLTVVTHELGHVLGLEDVANEQHPGDVMDVLLEPGVRRLPVAGEGWVGTFTLDAALHDPTASGAAAQASATTVRATVSPTRILDLVLAALSGERGAPLANDNRRHGEASLAIAADLAWARLPDPTSARWTSSVQALVGDRVRSQADLADSRLLRGSESGWPAVDNPSGKRIVLGYHGAHHGEQAATQALDRVFTEFGVEEESLIPR